MMPPTSLPPVSRRWLPRLGPGILMAGAAIGESLLDGYAALVWLGRAGIAFFALFGAAYVVQRFPAAGGS